MPSAVRLRLSKDCAKSSRNLASRAASAPGSPDREQATGGRWSPLPGMSMAELRSALAACEAGACQLG